MAFYFFAGMIAAALIGVLLSFILYRNTRNHNEDKNFLSSEKLLTYFIEIIIAVVGFGLTLNFSNENERRLEEENVIQILEQAKEYTSDRVSVSVTYYEPYENKELDWDYVENICMVNFDYYDNILADSQIIKHVDMYVYGYMMQCVLWSKQENEKMLLAEDEAIAYEHMKSRDQNIYKIGELLDLCIKEMKGEIEKEEAEQYCMALKAIRYELKQGQHGAALDGVESATD